MLRVVVYPMTWQSRTKQARHRPSESSAISRNTQWRDIVHNSYLLFICSDCVVAMATDINVRWTRDSKNNDF